MDRKVRILRLWLATALVVGLGCWEPALWFGVPLFFFPTCACCGPAAPSCFDCSPDFGGDFQATLAGFSNGTGTGCSLFNGTFEIPRISIAGTPTCNLQNDDIGEGAIVTCTSPNFGLISILTGNAADGLEVRVQAGSGVDMTIIYYHSSPSDCASYSSESITYSSGGGGCCNQGTVALTAI
jgi:hypothetical protein